MLALQKTDERQRKQEQKDERETNRQKNTETVRTLEEGPSWNNITREKITYGAPF